MTDLSRLKLFATHPHPCSYLSNKQATTLFVDPDTSVDRAAYSELADLGFRRSGKHIYRPHCADCKACLAARIPVQEFKARRSQRRIWNRNQDLLVEEVEHIDSDRYFELYRRYIDRRHKDGDMFPATREQYQSFLTKEWDSTRFFAFRCGDELLAVSVADQLSRGLAAVYTFFDGDNERRSLGSYAVLWQIEMARQLSLPYLYLGYWIKDCRKMNYKTDYQPLEILLENRWQLWRDNTSEAPTDSIGQTNG
jgi:arginine-tRNA-protein transferase